MSSVVASSNPSKTARVWYGAWVVLPVPLSMLVPSYYPPQLIELIWTSLFFMLGAVSSFWVLRHANSQWVKYAMAVPLLLYGSVVALAFGFNLTHLMGF
ncbi:MAG: hypothetical protein V4505_13400 [Pseudomonadota bacterium]